MEETDTKFGNDLDNFLEKLSSLLGPKFGQKVIQWKPLIHAIITPGFIINILHPLLIFSSVILLPHSYSVAVQIPIYLIFLLLAIMWCKFVTKLKMQHKKDKNKSGPLPTLVVCQKEGKEEPHFHMKNVVGLDDLSKKRDRKVNDSSKCKPLLALGDLSKTEMEQFEPAWLNTVIKQLWLNLRAAVEDLIMNVIWPDVRLMIKEYPANIDLELYSFVLGTIAPRIEKIKVYKDDDESIIKNGDLVVDTHLTFSGETAIEFRLKTDLNPTVSLKADSINVSVKIRVTLVEMMPGIPPLKGVEVTLLENPEIHWNLGGIGQFADFSWMDKIIQNLIFQELAMFVIPDGITLPINCLRLPEKIQEQVDQLNPGIFHSIIVPKPTGLVKVIVKSATNLPAKDLSSSLMNPKLLFKSPMSFFRNIFPSKSSSDPFVQVSVGSLSFESEVCFKTVNPEFDFCCEIPVECPGGQEVKVSFWDFDHISENDFLGTRAEMLENLVKKAASGGEGSELSWFNITGSVSARCLMSYQWIPLKNIQVVAKSGVVAFSIKKISGMSISIPYVRISLVKKELVEFPTDNIKGPDEWWSIPAFKESKEFKLTSVESKEFDLFLLQGGMLRFEEKHNDLLIEVFDRLGREDEIGKRIWKHQVSLTELAAQTKPGKSIQFQLEKTFDRKPNCVNKSKKAIKTVWRTLKDQMNKKHTHRALDNEEMQFEMMVSFYG